MSQKHLSLQTTCLKTISDKGLQVFLPEEQLCEDLLTNRILFEEIQLIVQISKGNS